MEAWPSSVEGDQVEKGGGHWKVVDLEVGVEVGVALLMEVTLEVVVEVVATVLEGGVVAVVAVV